MAKPHVGCEKRKHRNDDAWSRAEYVPTPHSTPHSHSLCTLTLSFVLIIAIFTHLFSGASTDAADAAAPHTHTTSPTKGEKTKLLQFKQFLCVAAFEMIIRNTEKMKR